jgi:hypothetical protein
MLKAYALLGDPALILNDVPTSALVSSFRAYSTDGRVTVEWTTAVEIDTVGYYLERLAHDGHSYVRVHADLVPANPGLPHGSVYEVTDHEAQPGETYTYRLVEITSTGQANTYGPFTVIVDGGALSFEEQFDLWLQEHFSPAELADQNVGAGTADADGDGRNNLEEFICGTDPNDASSILRMSGLRSADGLDVVVRWPGKAGRTYILESSDNLLLGFSPLADGIEGTPPVNMYTDSVSRVGPVFYRVRVTQ